MAEEESVAAEPIGERLRRLRRERGLSQRDLAVPGVSFTYVSRIESGQRQPSVKALRTLATKLGVTAEYLETGHELPPAHEREIRLGDAELELRLGDPARAEAALTEVLADANAAGDVLGATRARETLGLALARQGRHEQAAALLEELLRDARVPVAERPDLYATLGRAYAASGETPRAIALFRTCLDEIAAAEIVDPVLFVRFAAYHSCALTDAGDAVGAQATLAEALRRAEGIGDRYTLIRLYWSLGRFYAVEGPPARALDYVRRAIALLEATEDRLQLARAHELCATILLDQASGEAARAHLDVAEQLFACEGDEAESGSLLTERARLALQLGDVDGARSFALEALDGLEGRDPLETGRTWRTLAGVFEALDEAEIAERAYAAAVETLTAQGASRHLAETYRAWGKFLRLRGREDEALDVFERAADLAVHTVPLPAGAAHPRVDA